MRSCSLAGYTATEADELRKAVSKKLKEKLLKHREKFVAGAVEHGMPEETAGEIFDDWEEFARYGFNKAHAADYGVIAVQTAYLKAHYPVEYMTALLSVNQNDTAKIALYVADCRRMGITTGAPDVNISDWDFTIEDHPDGSASIRFGLGAVKNVGHGPVDAILKGRGRSALCRSERLRPPRGSAPCGQARPGEPDQGWGAGPFWRAHRHFGCHRPHRLGELFALPRRWKWGR